ncbi:MAG: PLDc_N domain-containing protein [Ktedonobacteraceae bacterium]|nr:PLDc_N domain-containing protein [Ktedonobacteraceae bacterium]
MAGSEGRGCIANSLLFLIIIFIPVVGQIIETLMILEDDHTLTGKLIWLVVVWLLPFIGPLLYLFFGQRPPGSRGRIMFGQPAYQQQYQR